MTGDGDRRFVELDGCPMRERRRRLDVRACGQGWPCDVGEVEALDDARAWSFTLTSRNSRTRDPVKRRGQPSGCPLCKTPTEMGASRHHICNLAVADLNATRGCSGSEVSQVRGVVDMFRRGGRYVRWAPAIWIRQRRPTPTRHQLYRSPRILRNKIDKRRGTGPPDPGGPVVLREEKVARKLEPVTLGRPLHRGGRLASSQPQRSILVGWLITNQQGSQ